MRVKLIYVADPCVFCVFLYASFTSCLSIINALFAPLQTVLNKNTKYSRESCLYLELLQFRKRIKSIVLRQSSIGLIFTLSLCQLYVRFFKRDVSASCSKDNFGKARTPFPSKIVKIRMALKRWKQIFSVTNLLCNLFSPFYSTFRIELLGFKRENLCIS